MNELNPSVDVYRFSTPKWIDDLSAAAPELPWCWEGLIPQGATVILSAHPKAGKTTLISDLLRAAPAGEFCGRKLQVAAALVITEEAEWLWAARHQECPFVNNLLVWSRPFPGKPSQAEWVAALHAVETLAHDKGVELIVFDTLSNLWPVQNENDAAQVNTALLPTQALLRTPGRTLLFGHHLKKADGQEGTGARGSSALVAFPDVNIELRRTYPHEPRHPRRALTVYGRWQISSNVELTLDGTGRYTAAKDEPDPRPGGDKDELAPIEAVLRTAGSASGGLTAQAIYEALRQKQGIKTQRFFGLLKDGVRLGRWWVEGTGRKGDPKKYSIRQDGNSLLLPTPPYKGGGKWEADPSDSLLTSLTPLAAGEAGSEFSEEEYKEALLRHIRGVGS